MADFTYDQEKHIVMDGKVYERQTLSEEQTKAVAAINFTDQELARQAQIIAVTRVGRDRLVQSLTEDLADKETPVIHELPEEEPAEESAK